MAIKVGGTTVINDNLQIENTAGIDLAPIAATIADTAVDVFVYDTRKDSDGGAWRKRTQHTSWYNETLNTATRGSRREFPAVAVIVVHQLTNTGKVTIYDGDDPDMPMWMVLNSDQTASDILPAFSGTSLSCVTAMNGTMMVGNSTYDISAVSFIEDTEYRWSTTLKYRYNGNIAQRSEGLGRTSVSSGGIYNRAVNDVAMTVLPNAPVDPATGLPVPTIAVATDGGTSIIKDDGSIVDITYTNFNAHGGVAFVDGNILITNDNGSTNNRFQKIHTIPSSDLSAGTGYEGQKSSSEVVTFTGDRVLYNHDFSYSYNNVNHTTDGRRVADNVKAFGHTGGFVQYDGTRDTGVMFNNATSSFATGYQVGDIKLATLSDTDATNVTGSELVTNGTFDTDTSGWSFDRNDGTTTASVSSGQLTLNRGSDSNSVDQFFQSITLVNGETYTLSFKRVSGSLVVIFNGTDMGQKIISSGTNLSYTFTAGSTSGTLAFWALSQNSSITIDDVSVRLAEEDRSVNNNGLQVFGTVTKTPVATGADLVAYSGFSGSNRLEQPYNSDLDFGTGDFCYMAWFKKPSDLAENTIVSRGVSQSTDGFLYISTNNSGYLSAYVGNGVSASGLTVPNNIWTHCVVLRRGSTVYGYVNGVEDVIMTNANSVTHSTPSLSKLVVGNSTYNLSIPTNGSLALLRASATAPSPEQIKKIYEDEKVLFQENAQATLYGASDAVTALAYDDSTNILSVGTSAGRSDFQGLRRVNNTTTAVTSAISASNGLIVEQ